MKRTMIIAAILSIVALASTSALAGVIFSEDWETGSDGWTAVGAIAPALVTDQSVSPTHSIRTADNSTTNYTNEMDHVLAAETGTNWIVTWNFFDTGATRDYLQIDSYSGLAINSGNLQQLMCFGAYNNPGGPNYNYRIALGSVAWQASSIQKTNNVWHAMKVEQIDNGDGTATVNM